MIWSRTPSVIAVMGRVLACVVALVATLLWGPAVQAAVAERVSVTAAGVQGDYESGGPSVSSDGRYVAFASAADNLVTGDTNGRYDVFVYDRQAHTVRRVSVATGGAQANGDSGSPAISGDGTCVAFLSRSTDLISGDTNGRWDVFVHTLATGVTTRVSVASDGSQADADSTRVSLSGDGALVCFNSLATDLVEGDTNGVADVFVRERTAGTTERVSVGDDEAQADRWSDCACVSADGRYVAFDSDADNLILADTNGKWDVFVRDRQAGTTVRASVDSAGLQASGDSICPSLSADGAHVAFESEARDLAGGDSAGFWDVFARDLTVGATERVSLSSSEVQGDDDSDSASVSGDGRYVAYTSQATNLASGDTNGMGDVFVRDRTLGTTQRVSISSAGVQGYDDSDSPALGAGGSIVAFESWAATLVGGDTNVCADVFVAAVVETPMVDTPVVNLYQQGDARLTYLNSWSPATSGYVSGGSFYFASWRGCSVTACFEGTAITVLAKTGPQYGIGLISLDGGPKKRVDFYSLYARYQQKVYTASGLANGSHTLSMEWTGEKRAAAKCNYVNVDALSVVGVLTQAPKPLRREQNDTHLVYSGTWYKGLSGWASGGSFAYLPSAGSVTVHWTGTSLVWVAKTSPLYGIAKLTLDGGTPYYVDLYSATALHQKRFFVTGVLPNAAHTLVIERSGKKNRAASDYLIGIDALDVVGTLD